MNKAKETHHPAVHTLAGKQLINKRYRMSVVSYIEKNTAGKVVGKFVWGEEVAIINVCKRAHLELDV